MSRYVTARDKFYQAFPRKQQTLGQKGLGIWLSMYTDYRRCMHYSMLISLL